MPIHKSEDLKLQAVKYYLNQNKNQVKTCKIFGCSERSLVRWVNKYKKNKTIKRKTRKYVAYKVKQEYVKFIKEQLKKDKTISLNILLNKLKKKYKNANLSIMQIHRVVKDNNITLKLTKLRHEPKTRFKKPVNINKQLNVFYTEVKKYKLDDILSIDETSINSYETRKHCYEEIGKRCTIKTTSQEVFKKFTGIFAISTKGVIGYDIYKKGGIDSTRLKNFINKFITGKYKNKLIIMDNASSHRNQSVKDLINKNNKVLYSIPYQHYTNAIENYFSLLKNKLRIKKGLGYDDIVKNLKTILKDIPKKKYKNIFEGSYNRIVKYIPKKSRKKTLKNYK